MRKFIIDQLLILFIGIGFMISLPFISGTILFAIIYEIMIAIIWGGLCWRILVFPLDLLHGKEEIIVYFSRQSDKERYESFRRYCFKWKFHYGSNQKISLLVPASVKKEELDLIECPEKNVPIKVTYYRYSKILIHWEEAEKTRDTSACSD